MPDDPAPTPGTPGAPMPEASFREMMRHMPLAMLVAEGPEQRVRFMSRAFEELFGYGPQEIQGVADWWPRAYPDPVYRAEVQRQWDQRLAAAAQNQGRLAPQDVFITCKDGSACPVRAEATLLGDAVAVTFMDLTEHRQAVAALRASEESYRRQFMDNASVMLMLDPGTGRILDANHAAARFYGHAREQLLTLQATDLNPMSPAAIRDKMDSVTAQRGRWFEVAHRLADGSLRDVAVSASRIHLGEREVLHAIVHDITDRKEAEQALRASEERHRTWFNRASDGIFAFSLDGVVLEANEAMARMHGYRPEEMVGMRVQDIDTPTHAHGVADRFERLRAGETLAIELEHFRKDGTTFPLEVTASLVTVGGAPVILAFHRDITKRKRAEQALQESEQKLNTILDSVDSYIFIKDRDYRYTYVNQKVCDLFGRSREEILGRSDTEFFTDASLDELRRSDQPVLERGETVRREETLISAQDGARHTFLAVKVPLRDASGAIVGLCGSSTDITQRKAAEQALRESEEQLRIIFEASGAGIILVAPSGEISFANGRMAQLFGLPLASLIGTPYPALVHPSEQVTGDALMHQLITGEIPSVSLERRYLRGDGTAFWGHLSGRRLEHPDGSLRALVGIITDITHRHEAEEQQRTLQAQLHQAQKMESLGSLAGGVAHDMNNVLGAILGLASAHVDDQPPGSPTQQAFHTIIKAAERGGNMLRSLLSFARKDTSQMEPLDLNAILREEARLLERTTLAKVRLVLDLAPELRPILGEAGALTHAFMNLSVNAVDAMPANGTLTLRTRNQDDGWVQVQVEDTGSGMAPELLEKVLDPFFTTKEVGKGTGLGLSIVYSTVKAHQGQMELHSEPGRGTCVTLRFPGLGAPAKALEPSGAHGTLSSQGGLAVLLVDDDELIQSSLLGLLQLLGHAPTAASSGEEGLAAVEAGLRPDVIILDMNMPGLGGAGTLPRLRALLPTVPILLATGRADQAAQDLVDAHPFVTLLAKPFGMKELQVQLMRFEGA